MHRFFSYIKQNPVWSKIVLFDLTLFLIWFTDGIIAFWAPVQINFAFKNTAVMGLIISLQSVAGLVADLLFPQLLKAANVRRLVFLGIISVAITSLLLASTTVKPFILLFLATMIIWGVYYEFIGFAYYQFMAGNVPLALRSAASGITGVFSSGAYFLGPVIAPYLLSKGVAFTEVVILAFLGVAFVLLNASGKNRENLAPPDTVNANPVKELKHWFILGKKIWPMLVMSMCLGLVDSSFWTIGAVWTEELSIGNPFGGLFLPLYVFPAIFVGFIIARLGIYKGKKRISQKVLLVAGALLMLIAISDSLYWQLAIVFMSGIAFAIVWPLSQSVYSDIVARMGSEKKHMIGLTNSVVNLAYIIWPPIVGLISINIGARLTFSYQGLLVLLTAVGLLIITPKKLKLPQKEIRTWRV